MQIPKIVASSSNDEAIQSLCRYNRKHTQDCTKRQRIKKTYILMCFGKKKIITKAEYDMYVSQGLTDLVKIIYE
jgi:hypothetical protein